MDLYRNELFLEALPLLQTLIDAGYEAYFVGGCVRDMLLGKAISDVDIATSATPQEVKMIFKNTVDIGIEHGTVLVLYHQKGYEITTFRTEEGYQDFRHPDQVTFVRSLEEDLKRRDFTINALALSTENEIIDFFEGRMDLEYGLLRCVGDPTERFNEDALRMFRAIRFVGQLGFTLEDNTKQAISHLRMNLSRVAVERLKVEFEKMIQSPYRVKALELFIETGLYEACPVFSTMKKALTQLTSISLEKMSIIQAWILLATFLHLDSAALKKLLKEWKSSNQLIAEVMIGYQTLLKRQEQKWDYFMAYDCPLEIAIEVEQLYGILSPNQEMEKLADLYDRLPIRTIQEIAINGHDIIQLLQLESKGPIIGVILQDLKEQLLSEKLMNEPTQLNEYILKHY